MNRIVNHCVFLQAADPNSSMKKRNVYSIGVTSDDKRRKLNSDKRIIAIHNGQCLLYKRDL